MRIAIPLAADASTLSESFSRASMFALYDIDNDTRAVQYLGRQSITSPSCADSPDFLRSHNVDVIMAHQLSENAHANLLESGIVAIQDAPLLAPDALIAHLVSGTLQATPPDSALTGTSCNPGGCGHCCGGGHSHHPEHTAHAPHEKSACSDSGCTSDACHDHHHS